MVNIESPLTVKKCHNFFFNLKSPIGEVFSKIINPIVSKATGQELSSLSAFLNLSEWRSLVIPILRSYHSQAHVFLDAIFLAAARFSSFTNRDSLAR